MPDLTDDQIAQRLRDAVGAEIRSRHITDAAERVARARLGRRPNRGSRPWALAGIAASLVVAIGAGLGLAAWRNQLVATATASASPTHAHDAGLFTETGSMPTPRRDQAAVLLRDGRVLIVGGEETANKADASAELYDPETGSFNATGSMTTPRVAPTATLLADGRVLVAGGFDYATVHDYAQGGINTAELYDPATGRFSPTGSMTDYRFRHTATLLADGRVLIAGGRSGPLDQFASAELFDPKTGTFSPTGSMATARELHTATRLSDGRVLVAGGGYALNTGSLAELYDPEAGTFTSTGPMAAQRSTHTATLLSDGRVLIAGGDDGRAGPGSAELYDPSAGTFRSTGSMASGRQKHTATLLSDGRVLVVGGELFDAQSLVGDGFTYYASAELFDPRTGTFSPTGSLTTGRSGATATLLPDGRVLIVGGRNQTVALGSAELYQP